MTDVSSVAKPIQTSLFRLLPFDSVGLGFAVEHSEQWLIMLDNGLAISFMIPGLR